MPLLEFTNNEISRLRQLLADPAAAKPTKRPDASRTPQPLRTHLALTPAGGIPGRSGATPGSALCDIYIRDWTSGDLTDDNYQETVYNSAPAAIAGDAYIPIFGDFAGSFWASWPSSSQELMHWAGAWDQQGQGVLAGNEGICEYKNQAASGMSVSTTINNTTFTVNASGVYAGTVSLVTQQTSGLSPNPLTNALKIVDSLLGTLILEGWAQAATVTSVETICLALPPMTLQTNATIQVIKPSGTTGNQAFYAAGAGRLAGAAYFHSMALT